MSLDLRTIKSQLFQRAKVPPHVVHEIQATGKVQESVQGLQE